jgi:hypothetical protein
MRPRHVRCWTVVLLVLTPAAVAAEGSLSHESPVCFRPLEHASIVASLTAASADVSASVLFRQEGTVFWYEAPFAAREGRQLAVLPAPARAGMRVEYALVVRSPQELQWRSEVFVVPVRETCGATEVPFVGSARKLTVLRDGDAPEKPPGFDAGDVATQVVDRTIQLEPESRVRSRPEAVAGAEVPAASAPGAGHGGTKPSARAQPQPLLSPPGRVRLWLRGSAPGVIVGQLLEVQERGLLVRPQDEYTPRVVGFESIDRAQVSYSRRSRIWSYAGYGGLLVLAGVWAASSPDLGGYGGLAWGLALSPIGVGVGACVGIAAGPAEKWQEMPASAWNRSDRRVSLRFSVGF